VTDRQAQYRASKAKAREAKRAAGLAPLEVWAKPSDHAAIRAFVAGLVAEIDTNLTQAENASDEND